MTNRYFGGDEDESGAGADDRSTGTWTVSGSSAAPGSDLDFDLAAAAAAAEAHVASPDSGGDLPSSSARPGGRRASRRAAGDAGVGGGGSGGGGGAASGEDEPGGSLLTDSVTLAAERDEYLAALQRMKADFDNYRKRIERTQETRSARAALDLVTKLLPVLDTLDLAVAHANADGDGGEPGADAVALTQARTQLVDVLAKEGLQRVDQSEVIFDPEYHDAVAHTLPSEDEPSAAAGDGGEAEGDRGNAEALAGDSEVVVADVLRAGYLWRGQVIRPAMVRVRG